MSDRMWPRRLSRPGTLLAALLALAALTTEAGCSSFEQEWKSASALPAGPTDVTGRWQGTWTSDGGHSGGLRCVVSRLDARTYRAHFDATYAGALHFHYVAQLAGEQAPDGYTYFQGDADLGALAGGAYHYDGRADAREFTSTYRSGADRGVFQMARPGAPPPPPGQ